MIRAARSKGRGAALAVSLAALGAGCAAPELPALPARCSDNQCPEGLACIHGVCAAPGTPIPITVATFNNFHGGDLKMVPQATTVLVTWQTYAYSEAGERFIGARVSADGSVSREMTLVSSFEADEDATEPTYDVLATSDTELLLAVTSAPLSGDELPNPRLITYSVHLPSEGQEAQGAQFGSNWAEEMRMSTIGFGAVSTPKLLARGDEVELGYFETLTAPMMGGGLETIGELAVIRLNKDGTQVPQGLAYYRARDKLPVAISVTGAFAADGGAFWALDTDRPSALFIDDAAKATEAKLERLSIPLASDGTSLSYLEPSARTGEKLPGDPVSGMATLHRLTYSAAGGASSLTEKDVGTMPTIRDTPRPAWVAREGKPSLLITPGADVGAPSLIIYQVDPMSSATLEVGRIDRFSSSPVDAVVAAVVGGKLFVAWAGGEDTSAIRMAIVPEP